MIIERFKSEGIAHNSYLVGSGSSALVIDPRRDCRIYAGRARTRGMKIKYILETHRNEDYVIGSLPLATLTGGQIFHGPRPDWRYGKILEDSQEFRLGAVAITALYTPGHTDDSVSYVLTDLSTGKTPVAVFCGDALFVQETGRVDFSGPAETPRMAANLYRSIFNRLLPLGDGVLLFSAHGGGSVCGGNIADRDESTLGIERLQNPGLQIKDQAEFVRLKTAEILDYPPYFRVMEKLNLEGSPLSEMPFPLPLGPSEFKDAIDQGALVVDTNMPGSFGAAHIRGSLSIWLDGLSPWAGWLLPYDKPLLLVLEDSSHLEQAVTSLFRLGYANIRGFLRNGIESWYNAGFPVESLSLLTVHQLKARLDARDDLTLLDVRSQAEWNSGYIAGSMHVYAGHLAERLNEIPREKPVVVTCSVGHRSGIAASILLRAGYTPLYNLLGGTTAWRQAGFPLVI